MKKIEFHIHTRYSKDSILSLIFLLIMCKLKKIDCIAITDHNEIKGAIKYKKKLKKHNIQVIVGEEIFTQDGEIIGLYLTERIPPNLSATDTINKIKAQNGLVYIPHPYDPYRSKTVLKEEEIKRNKEVIDLIEVHNGRNRNSETSKKQLEIAEKYQIRKVIGSDAHTFFELGRNNMIVSSLQKDKLLEEIEKSKTFSAQNVIVFAHKWTRIVKLIKLLLIGDYHELYRIINRKCRRKDI